MKVIYRYYESNKKQQKVKSNIKKTRHQLQNQIYNEKERICFLITIFVTLKNDFSILTFKNQPNFEKIKIYIIEAGCGPGSGCPNSTKFKVGLYVFYPMIESESGFKKYLYRQDYLNPNPSPKIYPYPNTS